MKRILSLSNIIFIINNNMVCFADLQYVCDQNNINIISSILDNLYPNASIKKTIEGDKITLDVKICVQTALLNILPDKPIQCNGLCPDDKHKFIVNYIEWVNDNYKDLFMEFDAKFPISKQELQYSLHTIDIVKKYVFINNICIFCTDTNVFRVPLSENVNVTWNNIGPLIFFDIDTGFYQWSYEGYNEFNSGPLYEEFTKWKNNNMVGNILNSNFYIRT